VHDLAAGRSVGLLVLAAVLHLGGLIAALYALPVAAWPVTVVLIGFAFWQAVRAKPGDVTRAQGQLDGEWTLTRRDGEREQGWQVDTARSFCQPWLVILALRRGRRRRYLPLAADAVNADALRRLRVSLRAAG
jgi:hypothetical protein